jgi:hypothetical protein
MIQAKLSEVEGFGIGTGGGLLKVMRNNDIDFKLMFDSFVESYKVPDMIRELDSEFLTSRLDPSYAPDLML